MIKVFFSRIGCLQRMVSVHAPVRQDNGNKIVRSLKGISGLWQSLELKEEKTETASGEFRQMKRTSLERASSKWLHPDNRCHTDATSRHFGKRH